MTTSTKIQMHLYLPPELAQSVREKAGRFGFKLPEYIRFLIANDVKEKLEGEIPYVDEKTERDRECFARI